MKWIQRLVETERRKKMAATEKREAWEKVEAVNAPRSIPLLAS